ncbi:hypothetical protein G5714_014293 [Onychostoma macrolepis]|uniref:Uncharacterized protein n=1 Tax=Onychostoma macrolepis TaxID=369639 RepID=A0A7J6CGX1_9TELE|nr:hypothetical protein G5714_014293 [Onychostoma macrolepis]
MLSGYALKLLVSKCANVSQTFHRHPALPAHQDHLKTRQSMVMDILQPKAANNLQWQRKEQRDCDTSGHLTPSLNHQEPTSIISSLVHDLLDLRQERNLYRHNSGKLKSVPPQKQSDTANTRLLVTFHQNRGLTTTCCPSAITTRMTADTASTPAASARGSAPCYSLHPHSIPPDSIHHGTTTTPGGNQRPESHHCLPAVGGRCMFDCSAS